MLQNFRISIILLGLMTLLTGGFYPALVTVVAQTVFSPQAGGSIMEADGRAIGSELIGQQFTKPEYFWGRLSATSPVPYNAAASSGSNLGPLNPTLKAAVAARIAALRQYDPELTKFPVDLVTASGSGLDPHISLAAAEVQVRRVAAARRIGENEVRELVRQQTIGRQFGLLGEPRVNVLPLNLALDRLANDRAARN
ncbi:MAG: potassium-transporting ATPase subunit KdpC [Planctomycetia bacterium]|nr:potassium-transporting ATPase subunit KdpC [Planctomycetia bacterium]